MGSKKLLKLNAFQLKEGINILDLKTLIKNSDIDHKIQFKLEEQLPLILNRYRRKYFETKDKKFRITIDDNQSFYKINTFNNSFLQKYNDSSNVILELKYDKQFEKESANITNNLPFRLTKSSKYARGIELFYI